MSRYCSFCSGVNRTSSAHSKKADVLSVISTVNGVPPGTSTRASVCPYKGSEKSAKAARETNRILVRDLAMIFRKSVLPLERGFVLLHTRPSSEKQLNRCAGCMLAWCEDLA